MDKKIRLLFDEIRKPVPKDKNLKKNLQIKKDNLKKIIHSFNFQKKKEIKTRDHLPFVFNQAPAELWYNWANSVGSKFTATSYSAGTTYILQNQNPLKPPQVLIFSNEQFNTSNKEEPLYILTLPVQGIRSALLIDDVDEPYVLLGTFSYPQPGVIPVSDLFRWNFISNKLVKILSVNGSNSIRTLIRYKNLENDLLFFSTQNDTGAAQLLSSINKAQMSDINTLDSVDYKTSLLSLNGNLIFGTVWDFYIDNNTIWISIPQLTQSATKLSGFATKGRAYYQNINNFLLGTPSVDIIPIIGNDLYNPGFNIDSLSTFQFQSSPDNDYVYIYSLSDFLYQFLAIRNNQNLSTKLAGNFEEGVKELRLLAQNLDIAGSRIFRVKKSDLFIETAPYISTVMGTAPQGTINESTTNNGYNNFLNIYTWVSTFDGNNMVFGTLDIRQTAYLALVDILIGALGIPEIKPILLAAPEEIKIAVTEFFLNVDFSIPLDFNDKQLYFDVIFINDKGEISKITSNGFREANPVLPDEGVRNLDIVVNSRGKFLLTGSTCYQPDNSAKIYTLLI